MGRHGLPAKTSPASNLVPSRCSTGSVSGRPCVSRPTRRRDSRREACSTNLRSSAVLKNEAPCRKPLRRQAPVGLMPTLFTAFSSARRDNSHRQGPTYADPERLHLPAQPLVNAMRVDQYPRPPPLSGLTQMLTHEASHLSRPWVLGTPTVGGGRKLHGSGGRSLQTRARWRLYKRLWSRGCTGGNNACCCVTTWSKA
jgi:hypothetical protein